jgi:TrmH family RNA methyltransferase
VAAGLRVVLVAPRNPLNIGAAARAMSNFGFTEMRLVNPYDVAFREAKSAVKSEYILAGAQIFESVSDAVGDCSLVIGGTSVGNRDLHLPLYRLEAAGQILGESLAGGNAAVLFGSEKFGLSNDDISHCHWLYRIPAREEHGSMNLGQAVAITLYELRRSQEAAPQRFEPSPKAEGIEFERITALLYKILTDSGYIPERTTESAEIKLRQLVLRLGIPASDTNTWLGILRQIQWKIDQQKPL